MPIEQQIEELRRELNAALLTRRERREANAQLARLLAEKEAQERAFDAALAALDTER